MGPMMLGWQALLELRRRVRRGPHVVTAAEELRIANIAANGLQRVRGAARFSHRNSRIDLTMKDPGGHAFEPAGDRGECVTTVRLHNCPRRPEPWNRWDEAPHRTDAGEPIGILITQIPSAISP